MEEEIDKKEEENYKITYHLLKEKSYKLSELKEIINESYFLKILERSCKSPLIDKFKRLIENKNLFLESLFHIKSNEQILYIQRAGFFTTPELLIAYLMEVEDKMIVFIPFHLFLHFSLSKYRELLLQTLQTFSEDLKFKKEDISEKIEYPLFDFLAFPTKESKFEKPFYHVEVKASKSRNFRLTSAQRKDMEKMVGKVGIILAIVDVHNPEEIHVKYFEPVLEYQ